MNHLISEKPGNIFILNDQVVDKINLLTPTEKDSLIGLKKDLKVYSITKTEDKIYYGLWGFLDVRLGVTYRIKEEKPTDERVHLRGKWYY